MIRQELKSKFTSVRYAVAGTLLLSSLGLSLLHYAVFHDADTFMFYYVLDFAFVPVQILIVTIIIEGLLKERERKAVLLKMNMVIGAFFSEMGSQLLRYLNGFCIEFKLMQDNLNVGPSWGEPEYAKARQFLEVFGANLKFDPELAEELKIFLVSKRVFVLGLLQNPNLLEHECFTNALWAITHLSEELEARQTLSGLSKNDCDHLTGDIKRAFKRTLREWLYYMQHLKSDYPYIYSLALRTHPYNPTAKAEIS